MIKLYNRQTGEYELEKVAGEGLLKFAYDNRLGRVGLEFLIKRKLCSYLTGVFCETKISKRSISKFVENFNIDMTIYKESITDFKSFNHFFIREVKAEARKFSQDENILGSPGDGRMRAWIDIDTQKLVQIKGLTYSLRELIADDVLAKKYEQGICIILRLAPVDYHRFHFVDSGVCTESAHINGDYYSVNPIALNRIASVFCRNKREYSVLRSDHFGEVLYIEVGATSVGSIVQTYLPQNKLQKGSEKGYFKFGGSTLILFLEKGCTTIDADILNQTQQECETRVIAGEKIGQIK